jgi:hypothetical protein
VVEELLWRIRAYLRGLKCPDCHGRLIGPYLGIGKREVWACHECGRAW